MRLTKALNRLRHLRSRDQGRHYDLERIQGFSMKGIKLTHFGMMKGLFAHKPSKRHANISSLFLFCLE